LAYSEARNLAQDPAGFAKFWRRRRKAMLRARPNAGHRALAQLQQAGLLVTHVTQNVDGLLHAAGAQEVLELHGNLRTLRCQACGKPAGRWQLGWRCWRCGGCLRPDVVLFGELLDPATLDAALLAASQCKVVLAVGTYASVYPATRILETATRFGAKLVVINPSTTLLGEVADIELREAAENILPLLVQDVRLRRAQR
jgi:NAD-dependent deacetylase